MVSCPEYADRVAVSLPDSNTALSCPRIEPQRGNPPTAIDENRTRKSAANS
jgi:hypothetical protein